MERRIDNAHHAGQVRGIRRLAAAVGLMVAATATWLGLTAYAAVPAQVRLGARESSQLHEQVLVNPAGRTLYHLTTENAHHIRCTGLCEHLWPPLIVHSRSVRLDKGAGVSGRLSLVRRPDGRLQVTLDGMPLYTFSHDHHVGDTNGQGVDGVWFVIPEGHGKGTKGAGKGTGTHGAGSGSPGSGHEGGSGRTAPEGESSSSSSSSTTTTRATTTTLTTRTTTTMDTTTTAGNGIPQENGGDHDSDNNGGPSDGDGNI